VTGDGAPPGVQWSWLTVSCLKVHTGSDERRLVKRLLSKGGELVSWPAVVGFSADRFFLGVSDGHLGDRVDVSCKVRAAWHWGRNHKPCTRGLWLLSSA